MQYIGVPRPVCWILLTTLPVETVEQCRRVVKIYRRRWLIEEMHKAMKTHWRSASILIRRYSPLRMQRSEQERQARVQAQERATELARQEQQRIEFIERCARGEEPPMRLGAAIPEKCP